MHALSTLFTIALLPAAALAAPAPVEKPAAVRLTGRTPDSSLTLEQTVAHAASRLPNLSGYDLKKPTLSKKQKRATVQLKNLIQTGNNYVTHAGTIRMGAPQQDVSVLFDTGSADLVMPITCQNGCPNGFFNTTKSRTFGKLSTEIVGGVYAGGSSFSGYVARDHVAAPGTNTLQSFIAVTDASLVGDTNWAGILGLQYHGQSNIQNGVSLTDKLVADGALPSNLFSMYFSRTTDGSELVLGGIDAAHYSGDLTSLYSFDAPYWSAYGLGFSVNGATVETTQTVAVFDSGTNANVVPRQVAAAIYAQISGANVTGTTTIGAFGEADVYQFPCSAAASVGLSFLTPDGDVATFNMQPSDFIFRKERRAAIKTPEICSGSFFGLDYDAGGMLASLYGTPLMRSFYTVFSYGADGKSPSVSLATSKA
ncbi:hypothetical protein JCM11641_006592 [Rhodosporidiobolus odoratus]